MIYPVILAGGAGTGLWPVSRRSFPKQFASLMEGPSLFQRTVERVIAPGFAAPTVIAAEEYRFLAQKQIADMQAPLRQLIVEPVARNTAAAILIAALAHKDTPEAVLLILPSDHHVEDERIFLRSVSKAARVARKGVIAALGVQPAKASTEYGYLRVEGGNDDALVISRYSERPEARHAEAMVAEGNWLWDTGIYLCRVDTLLRAFENHAPDLIGPAEAALALSGEDLGFRRLDRKAFGRCADLSFGKAVMENLDACTALHLACGWADLADWRALKDVCETDETDNLVAGNAVAFDCIGSVLKSAHPDTKIVGMGLTDIVAVATDDGILVANLSHSAKVGEMVATLRAEGAVQADGFRRCYRPWGYYETLSLGERFQVKRIMVEPGAKLSLQSHVHRAEHWVVVSGAARVTVNEDVRLLGENESTYIPLGAVHRLENPGKLPLHLIEVQSGCYLGEDDIVRYEDDYQRDEVL